jgi:MinD-like ATPase involved in chromosome partitioning or flagellar assembly
MKFLIDADLPRSTAALCVQRGYDAADVRNIGLGQATDIIAAYAKTNGLCLISGDFGFADIRNYPPEQYAGIVVLELPRTATASSILSLVDSFLAQSDLLTQLPGRLAIVSHGRVRLRPAP